MDRYTIHNTTICALASAPGRAGISVIRLSGPEALSIASRHLSRAGQAVDLCALPARRAVYADFVYGDQVLDDVVVLPFHAPQSYTGEDVVEISCHGSTYIVRSILQALVESGAEVARPGEFSQRAYLSGRLDLAEAEAVADIIASETQAQHRMAITQMRGGYSARLGELRGQLLRLTALMELELDFPEEDVEFADRTELRQLAQSIADEVRGLIASFRLGNAIKQGVPVALIGATNVGKSTLLNTLLGEERAIVSDIHGTTRDTVEDTLTLGGYLFRFIDTAGLRQTADQIEGIGIERSRAKMREAQVVLLLLDPLRYANADDEQRAILEEVRELSSEAHLIVLVNKCDLISPEALNAVQQSLLSMGYAEAQILGICAQDTTSVDSLRTRLVCLMDEGRGAQPDVLVNNARHHQLLTQVDEALSRLLEGMGGALPTDLLTLELRTAIRAIGDITGADITSDEALHYIFAHFCIGK